MAARARANNGANGAGETTEPQTEEQGAEAKAGRNGFDQAALDGAISRILNLEQQKKSLHGTYMADCKAIGDDIKQVFKDAKASGIPTKALRKHLKRRKLWENLQAERDEADDETQDDLDQIEHQTAFWDERVKDLPLFDRVMAESAAAAAAAAAQAEA